MVIIIDYGKDQQITYSFFIKTTFIQSEKNLLFLFFFK